MNYSAQRSALTRAVNSGDPDQVLEACRRAVAQWEAPDGYWPDQWSDWQRALDDAYGWPSNVRLDDFV
jgi:hypothetical protein